MILPSPALREDLRGIPRESGDDPDGRVIVNIPVFVFPARAGMIRWGLRRSCLHLRIPRESGDDPGDVGPRPLQQEYSPRERG